VPFLLYITLENAIKTVQEKQTELELNGTHHLVVYVDDINLSCKK